MSEKQKAKIPLDFSIDDFFKTQDQRDEEKKEHIEQISLNLIDDFKNHPFKVSDNEELLSLKESINHNGVLSAIIVRKKENGRYEIISGHRRRLACQKLGLEQIPCIVKDLTDDEATIIMVDSNLQRETILPSEKAFAYKMKYEALKHQGSRSDLTIGPVDHRTTAKKIGEVTSESEKTIRRYVRLTYLVPELLKMIDNAALKLSPSIAIRPGVELSYLKENEQKNIVNYIEENLVTPSHAQAIELKELSKSGKLSKEKIWNIMDAEKPNQIPQIKIQEEKLFRVVPKNVNRENIEEYVIKACEYYSRHLRQKNREISR